MDKNTRTIHWDPYGSIGFKLKDLQTLIWMVNGPPHDKSGTKSVECFVISSTWDDLGMSSCQHAESAVSRTSRCEPPIPLTVFVSPTALASHMGAFRRTNSAT